MASSPLPLPRPFPLRMASAFDKALQYAVLRVTWSLKGPCCPSRFRVKSAKSSGFVVIFNSPSLVILPSSTNFLLEVSSGLCVGALCECLSLRCGRLLVLLHKRIVPVSCGLVGSVDPGEFRVHGVICTDDAPVADPVWIENGFVGPEKRRQPLCTTSSASNARKNCVPARVPASFLLPTSQGWDAMK